MVAAKEAPLPNGAISVVIAGLAVAVDLESAGAEQSGRPASSRTSALAAAKTDVVQLASYDYLQPTGASPRWSPIRRPHSVEASRKSSNALKATLTKYKATADATVVSAGLVASSPPPERLPWSS